jgi:hypothetical protein
MAIERDDVPDPGKLLRLARQTMSSAERRKKYRRIDFLDTSFWYPTQLKFFAAGSSGAHQRLIYGGNQTGKTLACAAEVAWHCSGAYPHWWTGKRFNRPIRCWVVGESSTLVRDTLQRQLCGGDEFGTGRYRRGRYDVCDARERRQGRRRDHSDIQELRNAPGEAAIRNPRPGVD